MNGCSDSTNWVGLGWSFISFLNRRGANFTQGYQILGGTRFFMTPGLGLIGRGFDHAKWCLAVTNSIPCWSTCRMMALPKCCCYSVFCAKKSSSWKLLTYKTTLTPLPTFVPPFGLVICLWISASLNIRNSVCDYFYIRTTSSQVLWMDCKVPFTLSYTAHTSDTGVVGTAKTKQHILMMIQMHKANS